MIQIQCPFCEEECRVDAAVFSAETCSFRCDGCGVAVEVEAAGSATPRLLLAA